MAWIYNTASTVRTDLVKAFNYVKGFAANLITIEFQ